MSRDLSAAFKAALLAERSSETIAALITIEHDDLDTPLRISTDPTQRITTDPLVYGTVSRDETYYFLPIEELTLPEDAQDAPPAMRITFSNVSRDSITLLRSTTTPAKVTVEIVLASDPDQVETSFPDFDLTNADYDAAWVTLSLTLDALATEPFPAGSFTPASFPGLF